VTFLQCSGARKSVAEPVASLAIHLLLRFPKKGEVKAMTNEVDRLKDEIVAVVSAAPNQRLRPHEMEKDLARILGVSIFAVQDAVRTLAEEGRLVFTYRDPCSYVEIPAASGSARSAA
jgi:hypothetical protein